MTFPRFLQNMRDFTRDQRVTQAIADHIESNGLQDDPRHQEEFHLFVGASVGPEVEDRWAKMDMCVSLLFSNRRQCSYGFT